MNRKNLFLGTRRGILLGGFAALAGAQSVFAHGGSLLNAGKVKETGKSPDLSFSQKLGAYIASTNFEAHRPEIIELAKETILYHVGLAFSGAQTDHGRQAVSIARKLSRAKGSSTVIGQSFRAHPLEAAFANATFMRALSQDDVLFPSAAHAGLLTLPAAFAVAEWQATPGKELLNAIILGYDILGNLMIDQDDERTLRRPSMPFGPQASAAVTARLMQLDSLKTAHAMGYAADGAMGLKEGHEQQPTHIYGLIARTGIMGGILAAEGAQTAPRVYEGKYGFYAAHTGDHPDYESILERIGKDPQIQYATQKRYPGTAMNIVPIEQVRQAMMEKDIRAGDVKKLVFTLPAWRDTFRDSIMTGPFPSQTQAETSIPFQSAVLLLDGQQSEARNHNPNTQDILNFIAQKIDIRLDSSLTNPDFGERYSKMELFTKDGQKIVKEGNDHRFAPLDPHKWLKKGGLGLLPEGQIEGFIEAVQNLEDIADVRQMTAFLSKPET